MARGWSNILPELKTVPPNVHLRCPPARQADFVIEGYVDPTELLRYEGPFGDHTGYYPEPCGWRTAAVSAAHGVGGRQGQFSPRAFGSPFGEQFEWRKIRTATPFGRSEPPGRRRSYCMVPDYTLPESRIPSSTSPPSRTVE